MKGRHAAPSDVALEIRAYDHALTGDLGPLRGKRHKLGAETTIRCHYNAWTKSTERTHAGAPA
ncbi:hypothetical protein H9623_13090 [Oerskovia sp. Sa1BUA8]|uniref:Uncharacterized protein n=1 Tax=Oerskovia douganii TaxID=2762210 RepID=A0A9D5Z067_9CELL|nr:hypothetical protein [Oerskovia douganii]MBE7701231.1 hypothetical protein [Oerskovia douganii]